MSKIIVDEMPNEPSACPFSYTDGYFPDTETSNSHYSYGCTILRNPCCLGYGCSCDLLKELPKGGE